MLRFVSTAVLICGLSLAACKKQEKFETTETSVTSFKIAAEGVWTSDCTTHFAINNPASSAAISVQPNLDETLSIRLVTFTNSSNCGQATNGQSTTSDIVYNYKVTNMDSKEEARLSVTSQDETVDGLLSGTFKVKFVNEEKTKILISPLDGIYQKNGIRKNINPNVLKNKFLYLNRQI